MKTIVLKIADADIEAMQPYLHKTNRDLKNFIESLYKAAIRKGVSGMFIMDDLGKVNSEKRP